jgi:hypothetical protein
MPAPVRRLRTAGELGRIRVAWDGAAYRPLVDHYAVYASQSPDVPIDPSALLGKTVYSSFVHSRLGGAARTWHYRVVVVDAAGERSRPSGTATGTSAESVTVSGRPLATVGTFDHKSLELALAPNGSGQYSARFGTGVDFTYGVDTPGADWSYIHPGPADAWAGSRPHRFTFRFTLDTVPAGEAWVAVWLIDTHATNPGAATLILNGTPVREVALEKGATRGSLEGDATLPGSPLKPSYVELPLPRGALRPGENILEIVKNTGSWHVYDALGIYVR